MISFFRSNHFIAFFIVASFASIGVLISVDSLIKADVGDPQKVDTAQGIAEIVWIDDGDGTFTKQITVNGTVTAEPGTDRENLLLWHDTLVSQREVTRENARLRLISVKDDLLADLQQPNSPAVTRAIQAIIDIIETME